ncbi:MAG: hypothetical protein JST39_18230 [Bacteroidetes bacterium]|nr:hypothetical protein [Bacteroidota bacterium]
MRLPFGWNYCKIKSYDPFELGLTQKAVNDFTIDLWQRYFQLFGLPFFAVGRSWSITRQGQRYELPEVYRDAVGRERDEQQVHTPWYIYSGLMLLTLAGLVYVINSKYVFWERHMDYRKEYISIASENLSRFRMPTVDDYYVLTATDGTEKYAHITRLDGARIQLAYVNDPSVRVERPALMTGLFTTYADKLHTITIGLADSSRLICSDYEKKNMFTGMPLNNDDGKTYRISRILRVDGPIFRDDGNASYYANGRYSFSLNIENEGLAATITRIIPVEGDIEWADELLPLHSQPDKRIALLGKGDVNKSYKARIVCRDGQGRQWSYLLEGRRLHNTFRKIEM